MSAWPEGYRGIQFQDSDKKNEEVTLYINRKLEVVVREYKRIPKEEKNFKGRKNVIRRN